MNRGLGPEAFSAAIRDPRMMNHGRVLLALELHAARRYWCVGGVLVHGRLEGGSR